MNNKLTAYSGMAAVKLLQLSRRIKLVLFFLTTFNLFSTFCFSQKDSLFENEYSFEVYKLNDSIAFKQLFYKGKLYQDFFVNLKNDEHQDFKPIFYKRTYYAETSKIEMLANYNNNGKEDGIWYFFYPNGNLRTVLNYSNGFRIGQSIRYYNNGNVEYSGICDTNSANGILINYCVGKWSFYYENGKLKTVGNYSYYDPMPDEDRTTILTNLTLLNETLGITADPLKIRNGDWLYYDVDGKFVKKEIYKNGTLVETQPAK